MLWDVTKTTTLSCLLARAEVELVAVTNNGKYVSAHLCQAYEEERNAAQSHPFHLGNLFHVVLSSQLWLPYDKRNWTFRKDTLTGMTTGQH